MEWSVAVMPEPSMIPDRGVFLRAAQGRSLTATVAGIASDMWSESVIDSLASIYAMTVDVDEMEVVEDVCCCSTLMPGQKQENEEWRDLALFV